MVTVYADASHCDKTNACGAAYWLVSDKGRFISSHSGVLPAAYHAEMAAVFMAISRAVAIWDDATDFCINSDCSYVVEALNRPTYHLNTLSRNVENNKKIKEIYLEIKKIKEYLGLRIYARHVKAHTGKNDTRSYLNRRVDSLARKAMKIKRKQLLGVG